MTLLEAIGILPEGIKQAIKSFYQEKFSDSTATTYKLREIAAEFLERTLCPILESPVEVESFNWFKEFQISLQSLNNGVDLLKQADSILPRKWHTVFKICLEHELKILSEAWVMVAKNSLQKCDDLNGKLQDVSSKPERPPEGQSTASFSWGWPNPSKTLPTEQELSQQINKELQALTHICNLCIPVLLEHNANFRPSYFSISKTRDFQEWANEYRQRLKTIKCIKSFLRNVLTSSAQWRHVSHCSPKDSIQRIHQLLKEVDKAMKKLASQAMIITQQPQATIKKETKFDLEIEIFGADFLKVDQVGIPVITVINESYAECLHRDGILSQEIINGCGKVQLTKPSPRNPAINYNEKEQCVNVFYERMSIPKRPLDGSRSKAVLKQKHFILFHTKLIYDGEPVHVWACSSPFVYTTNTSQDSDGTATIFWDMYVFYKDPFNISPARIAKVWEVQAAFCRFVQNETKVNWELNPYSLRFLIEKLLGLKDFHPDYPVSRIALDEQRDPESGVSFWRWFMGAIKLIKEDLYEHWERGYIGGFLDRDDAENVINQHSCGTFLLRFASSQVGGLSLAWKTTSGTFSTILPKNEKGLLVGGINKLIADTEDISTLLCIPIHLDSGRWVQYPKCEVFTTNSPVNSPEIVPADGKKPYIKAFMMLSLRVGSLMKSKYPRSSPDHSKQGPSSQLNEGNNK